MSPGDWGSDLAAQIAGAEAGEFWITTIILVAIAIGGFVFAFLALHKARLIENTPTSRIRSAAQGYVELEGHARLMPGPEIRSPLSAAVCCWWKYSIEVEESSGSGSRRRTRWRTIASGTSDELFLLCDPTGECIVDPDGARVDPSLKRRWRGHTPRPQRIPERTSWLQFGNYRYTEQLLQIGDPLYAIGWFRTQSGHHEFDETADVTALLREWKADRRALLERFDADRDGTIDLDEWEAARRAALQQVRTEQLQRSIDPDVHVLCRPADRRPFLLSTQPQEGLVRRHRLGFVMMLSFSIISGTCAVFALVARGLL